MFYRRRDTATAPLGGGGTRTHAEEVARLVITTTRHSRTIRDHPDTHPSHSRFKRFCTLQPNRNSCDMKLLTRNSCGTGYLTRNSCVLAYDQTVECLLL